MRRWFAGLAVLLGVSVFSSGSDAQEMMSGPSRPTIQLLVSIPETPVQDAYLTTLEAELKERGYGVRVSMNEGFWERERIQEQLNEVPNAIGLVFLQEMIRNSEEHPEQAAVLLSTPGGFADLESYEHAQSGPVGDAARSEIGAPDLFALRLWPHSSLSLVSTRQIDDLDDFAGATVGNVTGYAAPFLRLFGAAISDPVEPLDTTSALSGGDISAAVFPSQTLGTAFLAQIRAATVIPDFGVRSAVAVTSRDWWISLRAREQREILESLDRAAEAASGVVSADRQRLQSATIDAKANLRGWSTFNDQQILRAVASSLKGAGDYDPDKLLEWRDEVSKMKKLELQEEQNGDEDEEGSLKPARVFFATDRRYHADELTLADSFDNAASETDTVRCGEMRPAEPTPFLGSVEQLVRLKEESVITVGADDCLSLITDAIELEGGKILIFVHGYNTTFDEAVQTGLAFARDAKIDGVVTVWSWPSLGGVSDYGFDEDRIEVAEPHFLAFTTGLLSAGSAQRRGILAHSMGSRLAARLMRDSWPGASTSVAFAAADLYRSFMDQALRSVGDTAHVTVLATRRDNALWASSIVHRNDRVGQAQPLYLHDAVDTIDLSAFDEWYRLNHGHAFTAGEVIADLSALFSNQVSARARGLEMRTSQHNGRTYFVIEPDGT